MFIKLTELFAGAVESGFEGDDADAKGVGHLLLAAAFLCQGDERAILGFEFGQSVPERIEFFAVDGGGRLGNFGVFFLLERGEQPLPALAAQMIDAGVASHPEEPGFELSGLIETWKRADHFDENDLGEIFDAIAASRDGVDEAGYAVLVGDDESALRVLVALLRLLDELQQGGRFDVVHARAFSDRVDVEGVLKLRRRFSCNLRERKGLCGCKLHVLRKGGKRRRSPKTEAAR